MLTERFAAAVRQGDGLDDVRRAALDAVRPLVDLLVAQREIVGRHVPGPDADLRELRGIQAEIEAWLGACSSDDQRRAAAITLMLAVEFGDGRYGGYWEYREELEQIVPGTGGWAPGEVGALVAGALDCPITYTIAQYLRYAVVAAETLDADGIRAAGPWLHRAVRWFHDSDVETEIRSATLKRIWRLMATADPARIPPGLVPEYDPWAAALREFVADARPEQVELVLHLAGLSGPRPSAKWRRRCRELVQATSAAGPLAECLRGLAEADGLCNGAHELPFRYVWGHFHCLVHPAHADLARGVIWAAALEGGPGVAADLAAITVRTGEPKDLLIDDLKLAGAAVNALGEIDDPAALEGLWRCQRALRHRGLLKQLDKALLAAAGRQGITPEQLVERSVPAHELAADGAWSLPLGDHRAVVRIEDAHTVRISYAAPDGRTVRSVPAAVKEPYAEEITAAKARVKEVRATLSGERARLESLMSAGREWAYADWCRYYRDHPITGAVARALIWEFAGADGCWTPALPAYDGLITTGGRTPDAPERVRLWHPMRATTTGILAWRELVTSRELRQPFKQAFREIYLLTPAEEETGVYSNRFAAHIVHYPRLYALFKERGWQANRLGRYDGGYEGEARGTFADGEWCACLYHEPADEEDHPRYAATDQVRFAYRAGRDWREAPLADVPPVVFSEAMRDVDLFVGVTSIAADPEWADRGEDRYGAYWRETAFAELTASAELRRDVLARILPRTKIAGRCALDGRYLTVRGDLRTYRIHLGSANILMEPDDSYLCIVPDRRGGVGKVFLPFEDERLTLILSKAFLLAADTEITDETILHQIKRGD